MLPKRMNEVFHPPRGFWIGVIGRGTCGMIGPFATEREARKALESAEVYHTGTNPTLPKIVDPQPGEPAVRAVLR